MISHGLKAKGLRNSEILSKENDSRIARGLVSRFFIFGDRL